MKNHVDIVLQFYLVVVRKIYFCVCNVEIRNQQVWFTVVSITNLLPEIQNISIIISFILSF